MISIVIKIDEKVYSAKIRNDKFELLTDSGSNNFVVFDKDKYWDWWKEKVGYYDETCDILTIYSDGINISSDIAQESKKEWRGEELNVFFSELRSFKDGKVTLEFLEYDDENQILKLNVDGIIREFGSNKKIEYSRKTNDVKDSRNQAIKVKEKKEKIEEVKIPIKVGSIREYYENKTKQNN